MRLSVALLMLCLAFAAHGAERALARFELPDDAPPALAPLLGQVREAVEREAEAAAADEDERLLRRLRRSAIEALATEGYFSPAIAVAPDASGQARKVLRVTLGARATIAAVEIDFSGAIAGDAARAAQLRATWALPVGQPFRDQDWSEAKARLLDRVRARDYAAASLTDSTAEVDAGSARVRLHVAINSGPAYTFGALDIHGLERYTPALVERYNPPRPGERYDAARLLEFQRRLQQSQFFATVLVEVDTQGSAERAPIRVDLTEAKLQHVALGLGYSTDTGPRAEATYRRALLFGHPYTLSVGASDDRVRGVGFADLLLPRRPDGALDSLGVLREKTAIEGVLTDRWAIGARRNASREAEGANYDTQWQIGYESETRSLADASAPPTVSRVVATTYTWSRRAVDQVTDPTRGDLLTLSATLGLQRGSLGTLLHQSFVRLYGRYVRWIPLTPRDQLILRGEAGHVQVQDPDFVPNEYLFRTGGTNSVRGYAYQSLGVRVGSATTGSKELLVGSAEYVRWLDPAWGAATFYDVGDAADDLGAVRFARGYGVGARYRTLAGPLALDLAYGQQVHQWRLHFSIAIAF